MFSFFKKKSSSITDLSWLQTDMHSHLIPGIDDGSPDLETSVELIKGFAELGYKKIITTPHILWEIYPNTPEIITDGLIKVQQALAEASIDIELIAAAEYFIDEYFQQQLKDKKPLLALKDNLILVEFSMVTAPMDIQEVFFEMQIQGYQPLIAHPERYIYLRNKKHFFDDLRTAGCMFQLNMLSLAGHYGSSVKELANYLLKKDYYDYAGTDLHHHNHLSALKSLSSSPLYSRLKDSQQIKNHLL
ncbi:MAG: tyrosine-protein phosphatase [Chitinophagaceae bacterium]